MGEGRPTNSDGLIYSNSSLLILTLKTNLWSTGSKPHSLTPNPFSPLYAMERGQG
jgi:hypothetical protein